MIAIAWARPAQPQSCQVTGNIFVADDSTAPEYTDPFQGPVVYARRNGVFDNCQRTQSGWSVITVGDLCPNSSYSFWGCAGNYLCSENPPFEGSAECTLTGGTCTCSGTF